MTFGDSSIWVYSEIGITSVFMSKILIIDDNEQVLEILRSFFESNSYEVSTASHGAEGLRNFSDSPADIVMTDIVMPEKDGLETIQEFQRDFPDAKIIAMSGGGRTGTGDYLRVAELYGARYVFKKPFKLEEVLTAVEDLLAE